MTQVQIATIEDMPAWLHLAAEVEPLFGPMVQEPSFLNILAKNLQRGSALCVREGDGPAGTPLLGGIFFSFNLTTYRISWLAVAERARNQGHGSRLLQHALALVTLPATISVITFGPDNYAGQAARYFYRAFGFVPEEMTQAGPEGGSRQLFRLHLGENPG